MKRKAELVCALTATSSRRWQTSSDHHHKYLRFHSDIELLNARGYLGDDLYSNIPSFQNRTEKD